MSRPSAAKLQRQREMRAFTRRFGLPIRISLGNARLCAMHEAGHAVVALALGHMMPVVVAAGQWPMASSYFLHRDGPVPRDFAAIAVAGMISEGTPRIGPDDARLLAKAATDLNVAPADVLRQANAKARELLLAHAPAVHAMADALVDRKRLWRAEAEAVAYAASPSLRNARSLAHDFFALLWDLAECASRNRSDIRPLLHDGHPAPARFTIVGGIRVGEDRQGQRGRRRRLTDGQIRDLLFKPKRSRYAVGSLRANGTVRLAANR